MPGSIKLQSNVPLTLTLLNPEGELDERYELVHYQTDSGTLTLSYRTAARLNILELRSGEQFGICKRQREVGTEYDIWRTPASEQARAAEETKDGELPAPIRTSHKPADHERGTGTHGPAPLPIPKLKVQPPSATPYAVALRHINQTVVEVLNASGEQWTSEAKQDLVSTLFIQAAKSKQISFDFTGEASQ